MSIFRPLRALQEAIGDMLDAFGGLTMTRLTADLVPAPLGAETADALTAEVESTWRFPSSGVVVIRGEVIPYTGKSASQLTGLTRDDSVRETYRRGEPIALWTRDQSALENARAGLLVDTAEGAFLDVLGRNYGVPRYLDAGDALYRRMIRALAYQAGKGSRWAIEEFLALVLDGQGLSGGDAQIDANMRSVTCASAPFTEGMVGLRLKLTGATTQNQRTCQIIEYASPETVFLEPDGSPFWQAAVLADEVDVAWELIPFNVIEDPWKRCTVIVELRCAPPDDATGFAYLQGGERAMPSDVTHVTVASPIRQVLGVWLATDPERVGTNYSTTNDFVGDTITLDTPMAKIEEVIVDYGSVDVPADPPTSGIPGRADGPATAQLLADVTIRNPGTEAEATALGVTAPIVRYPLYIGDRVGTLRALLDLITVAGVVPELEVRTW